MKTNMERTLYVLRACNVSRWHVEPVVKPQNVGEHSARVALWITLFHTNPHADLLKAALWHDLEERTTGDLPHWTKHKYPQFRIAASEIERDFREDYALGFELNDNDRMWLNAADLFDAWLHLWQEVTKFNNTWLYADYERCTLSIHQSWQSEKFPKAMFVVFKELANG